MGIKQSNLYYVPVTPRLTNQCFTNLLKQAFRPEPCSWPLIGLALCITNRFSLARKANECEMCDQQEFIAKGSPSHGACKTGLTICYIDESMQLLDWRIRKGTTCAFTLLRRSNRSNRNANLRKTFCTTDCPLTGKQRDSAGISPWVWPLGGLGSRRNGGISHAHPTSLRLLPQPPARTERTYGVS